MIKVILFDTYGVIFRETEMYQVFFEYVKKCLKLSGKNVTDDEFENAVKHVILSYVPSLTMALFWHFYKPDVEKCNELTNEFFIYEKKWINEHPQPLNSGIKRILQSLAASYKLALAGNAPSSVRDVLNGHGVLKYFTQTDMSEDIGLRKSDPGFFSHILQKLKVHPSEAIMIGDRLDCDIILAKLLGMKAILVKSGPYTILEPRTPDEIPDVTIDSVSDLLTVILQIVKKDKLKK